MNASWSWLFRAEILLSRRMLWMLLIINSLGTVYGYQWYSLQLQEVAATKATWLLFFVPDSPTASLFFTLAVIFLLADSYRKPSHMPKAWFMPIRGMIEALAVITSVKYGIWAVAMIFLGFARGLPTDDWQDWMLIVSHLGMAVEAMMFARFFDLRRGYIMIASLWTLCNDFIDYRFDVYPSLSHALLGDLPLIQRFTVHLSFMSIGLTALLSLFPSPMRRRSDKNQV